MDAHLATLREQVLEARRQGRPLRLRGAGTKDFYGETLEGTVLELAGHRGIVDYEPSELVVTARCGTRLSELEAALAEHDQFLGFEPPAFDGDPTIGGIVAAGLAGPRRFQAGAARDFVLGTRLLTSDGAHLRFGGQVMKNVAGFDVSRLLCGSLGIFGIITEISLKVLPRPRTETTLLLEASADEAIERFNRWLGKPLPITGAAWWDRRIRLRLSGARSAVDAAVAAIGGERLEPAAAERFWNALRDDRHELSTPAGLWRLSVPSAAPIAPGPRWLLDWAGALRWCAADTAHFDARGHAQALGGSAMRWRDPAATGDRFHPLPAALSEIHRRLKQRLDPHGLFNPGRLLRGL